MLIIPGLFHATLETGHGWSSPHISSNETGEVVFEWWLDKRKITMYVGDNELSYVKVWGDDMDLDMEDGLLGNWSNEFKNLWSWINS